jgi:hypothetical protein
MFLDPSTHDIAKVHISEWTVFDERRAHGQNLGFTITSDLIQLVEFLFVLVGLEFELRALSNVKQVFYCLHHRSMPFCSGYFGDGVS